MARARLGYVRASEPSGGRLTFDIPISPSFSNNIQFKSQRFDATCQHENFIVEMYLCRSGMAVMFHSDSQCPVLDNLQRLFWRWTPSWIIMKGKLKKFPQYLQTFNMITTGENDIYATLSLIWTCRCDDMPLRLRYYSASVERIPYFRCHPTRRSHTL